MDRDDAGGLSNSEAISDHPVSATSVQEHNKAALRVLAFVIAALGLLLVLPSLPSGWSGISHLPSIRDLGAGNVRITNCSRGDLLIDWTCSGTWSPNDPMAHPTPSIHVTVKNDAQHLTLGTDLAYVRLERGIHDAYNAGATKQGQTVALWLGVLAGLATLVLIVTTRRSRLLSLPASGLALEIVFFALAWGLIVKP